MKIDFNGDSAYGPFGVISRNDYNALPEVGKRAINFLGYERNILEMRVLDKAIMEFEEESKRAELIVG